MDKRHGILIVSVTILVLCFVGTASATNWSVDRSGGADFTRIQDAINNASDGDTIIVHSGIYYENVVVDKSVTLKGIDQPVVDAGGEGNAIRLTADGITLVGFNATNAGSSLSDDGIKVTSNNNTITGNNVSNNGVGIGLYFCRNNTITGNNVSNNGVGICLSSSSNNTITGNNASSNNENGIDLYYSSNNTITGNNASSNNDYGIFLFYSSNNSIIGNNASSNNDYGIYLYHSSNNSIIGNNINNNNDYSIINYDSCNNKIYLNNFIDNTEAYFVSDKSTNIWNSTKKITYTYLGITYESYLGNYRDNYEGTDADGDGIGNIPYSIDSEKDESDYYPLMKPFENYYILTSAHA